MEITLFIISFIASFLFALGGVGAAIILIPILVYFGVPITTAKPVGLFYNTVSMMGASIYNIRQKNIDYKIALPIIITSLLTVVLGAFLTNYISNKVILILFILFLFFTGSMFLFQKSKENEKYKEGISFLPLISIGGFAGLLSGLLGIGSGGIVFPLLIMLKLNPKKITPVVSLAVPFSSIMGFIAYWSMGEIDWKLTLIMSSAGLIGATLGTRFSQQKLKPEMVKKILAVIILIVGVSMLGKVF